MAFHKWRRRPSRHFGEVWVPFAQIDLQTTDTRFQTLALQIDSGAVVSLLRQSVAELLGLDLRSGQKIDVASVGGGTMAAYVHTIHTRFAPSIAYPVRYAIADTETVPNLLGRLDVFDHLQFDFDGTFEETRVAAPWLNHGQRQIWEFLIETEQHILDRWNETGFSDAIKDVARRFINRAEQILACVRALLVQHNTYAAPALIRSLLELALQFEYLMRDPEPRAQEYREYAHISKHKLSRALARNPKGPISDRLANSPNRQAGEQRNQNEYDRVRAMYEVQTKKGKTNLAQHWYKMSVHDLAQTLGRDGEYRLVYALCSSWTHGDPFSTQELQSNVLTNHSLVFIVCIGYYARMLLHLADAAKLLLTADQHDYLTQHSVGPS